MNEMTDEELQNIIYNVLSSDPKSQGYIEKLTKAYRAISTFDQKKAEEIIDNIENMLKHKLEGKLH